ncbi:MAG: 4Fe-4S dicluster domain-containing protein [Ruminococcaceae bacterium]|nr:4Fe-4S dicluster domain-containing protein [Oscillospiraceae bacterium]
MKLVAQEKCTGCGACISLCPQQCIAMKQNAQGFFVPEIDESRCVDCGKCRAVCHVLKEHNDVVENSSFSAVWAKEKDQRFSGSSGGVFGLLAEAVLNEGGIVFGAAFSDDYKSLAHRSTDSVSLEKLKKSKYFESEMGNTVADILAELKKDRWVLFCGTPCQAMGLRSAFGEKYDKLIICDFLCYGVPSQTAYRKYISDIEKKYDKKVKSVSFRSKKLGWKTYCMYIEFEGGGEYLKTANEDPFLKLFFGNVAMRDCCYECKRAEMSEADITLGDFWGVTRLKDFTDTDEGISLVAVHNEKGQKWMEKISEKLAAQPLEKEWVEYAYNKKMPQKRGGDINFYTFDFFDNDILPKNNLKTKLKSFCFKNKFIRKLIYKKG